MGQIGVFDESILFPGLYVWHPWVRPLSRLVLAPGKSVIWTVKHLNFSPPASLLLSRCIISGEDEVKGAALTRNSAPCFSAAASLNCRRPESRLHTLHFHPPPLWLKHWEQNGNCLAQQHSNKPQWDPDNKTSTSSSCATVLLVSIKSELGSDCFLVWILCLQ